MKKIAWTLGIVALLAGLVITIIKTTPTENDRVRTWSRYEGKIAGYSVVIDEIRHEKDFGLNVYLIPEGKNFYFASSYCNIPSFPSHPDRWDYVRYCKQPFVKKESNPFNGEPWKPCSPAEEITLDPRLNEVIPISSKMTEAHRVIYNSANMTHSEFFRAH